jgi:hypothetical protein
MIFGVYLEWYARRRCQLLPRRSFSPAYSRGGDGYQVGTVSSYGKLNLKSKSKVEYVLG